jgi:hypothetical protein
MLETHELHSRIVVALFLGHAPSTMNDRHNATPSQARFNAALAWLGAKYGEQVTGQSKKCGIVYITKSHCQPSSWGLFLFREVVFPSFKSALKFSHLIRHAS